MNYIELDKELNSLAYHGRGIIIGKSPDGRKAVTAYFIMGRSENSRNRVFVEDGEGIRTQAFDPSKMVDPHLIIYAPVRVLGNKTIVTNGDQTDTIRDYLAEGKSYFEALRTRQFEPDAPNYTSRISAVVNEDGSYALSILKNFTSDRTANKRFFYEYDKPVTSSTPTCATATRCPRSAASPSASASSTPSTSLQSCCGIPSTSRIRSPCSCGISTLKPARRRPSLRISTRSKGEVL